MTDELIPHVDKQDHFLGLMKRSQSYREGLPHRSVHAFVHSADDLFLLQQRSDSKQTWPGKWDLSFGETVQGEETFEAAVGRGLAEELGVKQVVHPKLIHDRYYVELNWPPFKVNGVICLYEIEYAGKIKLEDGEVQAVQWLPLAEVTKLVTTQPELCTPWLVSDWQFYLDYRAGSTPHS